jgi:hypothetical protein
VASSGENSRWKLNLSAASTLLITGRSTMLCPRYWAKIGHLISRKSSVPLPILMPPQNFGGLADLGAAGSEALTGFEGHARSSARCRVGPPLVATSSLHRGRFSSRGEPSV